MAKVDDMVTRVRSRVLVMAALLAGGAAWACRPAPLMPRVVPGDGRTAVPTNVVVRVVGFHPSFEPTALRLVAADDTQVAAVVTTDLPSLASLTPRAPLAPQTRYRLVDDDGLLPESAFTTGDGPDTTPPARPELGATRFSSAECGARQQWTLSISGGTDDVAGDDTVLLIEGGLAPAAVRRSTPELGSYPLQNFEPPAKSAPFTLTGQAMDWAGNLSEPSAVRQTPGCAAAPAAVLALAALLLGRRRRRSGDVM